MLKLLIHKQLSEIFRAYLYDAKKNKTRSKGATAAYIVLFVLIMAGMLGGMFTYLSLSICEPLSAAGMDWLYFALMGLIAILLGSFGSVFNTYSGLYLAKDNDLLLSMPIPVGVIMTARLLVVYIMGLLYSGVVIIPAAAVCQKVRRPPSSEVSVPFSFSAPSNVRSVISESSAIGVVRSHTLSPIRHAITLREISPAAAAAS